MIEPIIITAMAIFIAISIENRKWNYAPIGGDVMHNAMHNAIHNFIYNVI